MAEPDETAEAMGPVETAYAETLALWIGRVEAGQAEIQRLNEMILRMAADTEVPRLIEKMNELAALNNMLIERLRIDETATRQILMVCLSKLPEHIVELRTTDLLRIDGAELVGTELEDGMRYELKGL